MEAERLPRGVRERHLKLSKGGLSDGSGPFSYCSCNMRENANLCVNGTLEALDELERRRG